MSERRALATFRELMQDRMRHLENHHYSMRAALEAHKNASVLVVDCPEVDLGFWNKVVLIGLAQTSTANMLGTLKRVLLWTDGGLSKNDFEPDLELLNQAAVQVPGVRGCVISEAVRQKFMDLLDLKDLAGDDLPNEYPADRPAKWCEEVLGVEADFRKEVMEFMSKLAAKES